MRTPSGMKTLSPWLCAGLCAFLAGCAHSPPRDLLGARQAYQRASAGPATQAAPVELHKAQEALLEAEHSFKNGSDPATVRDLSYIATRKAQLAEATATAQLDQQARDKATAEYQQQQAQLVQKTQGQLAQTREQLAEAERARLQEAQTADQERQGRLNAEQKAADADRKAQAALARLADVKQQQRGLVITLNGSVLFPSDQATLLPEAQTRLSQVAEALLATRERTIVVEGYTDSRGSEAHNLDLSQRRAQAVRDYLVSRSYPPDKIVAQGLGKARPVADNGSAEGRANNRRVEIVVQPKPNRATAEHPNEG